MLRSGRSRFISVAVGVVLGLGVWGAALMTPSPALAVGFSDVGAQDWFAEAVDVLSDAGVVQGSSDGTFRPYDPITRAELSVLVSRCLDLPAGASHPFGDIPAGSWYESAVASLYSVGLANGVTEGVFDPLGRVSRQQAASFVLRAFDYKNGADSTPTEETAGPEAAESEAVEPEAANPAAVEPAEPAAADPALLDAWLQGFADRGLIAVAHQPAVADAYRLQILSGQSDGRFYPLAEVTRAQCVGMLYEALFKTPVPLGAPPAVVSTSPVYPDAYLGSRGPHVLWLEQRLSQLTYRPGTVDGVFDERTLHAVIAFQKWERLGRDGRVGAGTWDRLVAASRPTASQSDSGIWIEVSLARQVFLYVEDGVVTRTIDTSTGRSFTYRSAPYVVQRKPIADGPRYRALYLNPGYVLAIHGYPSVPTYPASDGCVRLPKWEMDALRANDATNPMIPDGTRVYIR